MALTDGLVHGWNLNNDLLDAFGAADGVNEGAYFTTPAPLGSHQAEGNGIDDYAKFGNILNFDYDEPFSVSFILTPKDLTGAQVFINKMTPGGVGWDIYLSGATLFFRISQTWSSKAIQVSRSITLTEYHFVCTYDGSNSADGMKIYRNNIQSEINIINNPMDVSIVNTAEFSLFARNGGVYPSNIKLDAVYVWDREITPSEVSELYGGGSYLELISDEGIVVFRRRMEGY